MRKYTLMEYAIYRLNKIISMEGHTVSVRLNDENKKEADVWTEFSEQCLGNSFVGLRVLHAERKYISAAHSEAPAIWISGLLFTMVIRYLHRTHHQFSGPWRVALIRKAWSQSVTAEVTAPMQTAPDSQRFNWGVYTGSTGFCPYHLTCFSFSQSI